MRDRASTFDDSRREWPKVPAAGTGVRADRRQPLAVAEAGIGDITFLVRNVARGAGEGVFSARYFDSRSLLKLAFSASIALLHQKLPQIPFKIKRSFLAVRRSGATVAAALVMSRNDGRADHLLIDCIVVDPNERRRSIGRGLVEYCVATAAPGSSVTLFCTSYARGMKKIAHSLGFKNVQNAQVVNGVRLPHQFTLLKK
jgi:N-acetylglutamate synthase-like GNAT family acetyltransferase